MDTVRFDEALVIGAQGVLVLALAWGGLLLGAALVETTTRGRVPALARVGCPVAWRPVLLSALGVAVSLAGVAVGPAQAAPREERAPGPTPTAGLLPVPARPVDDRPLRPGAPAPVVTVAAGDSLWGLARARLGDAASPARVQELVLALHHANRAVVGPDPDLLHPGQRLRVPVPPSPREEPQP